MLNRIYQILDKNSKLNLLKTLGLAMSAALVELAFLFSSFLFLSILFGKTTGSLLYLSDKLGMDPASTEFFRAVFIQFFCLVLLAGAFRISLIYFQARTIFEIGHKISIRRIQAELDQEFDIIKSKSSDKLISNVTSGIYIIIYEVLSPIVRFYSSLILVVAIMLSLLFIDPISTITVATICCLSYLFLIKLVKVQISKNSSVVDENSTNSLKLLLAVFNGFREVRLYDRVSSVIADYENDDFQLRKSQASTFYLSQSPRYIIETLIFSMITLYAYHQLSDSHAMTEKLPVLATFSIAGLRLLPLVQAMYGAWAQIKGASQTIESLGDGLAIGEKIKSPKNVMDKITKIELQNVSKSYGKSNEIFKHVNLTAERGQIIGLVGETGSGKSTLIDVITGLSPVDTGQVMLASENVRYLIQDVDISKNFAIVPQTPFFFDASIYANVAFEMSDGPIDKIKVEKCLELVELTQVLSKLPEGLETYIGRDGLKISGGQRQRLALARALYKDADVLFFDEITSSLDPDTQEIIIRMLKRELSHKIVFFISHRPETLVICDKVFILSENKLLEK